MFPNREPKKTPVVKFDHLSSATLAIQSVVLSMPFIEAAFFIVLLSTII